MNKVIQIPISQNRKLELPVGAEILDLITFTLPPVAVLGGVKQEEEARLLVRVDPMVNKMSEYHYKLTGINHALDTRYKIKSTTVVNNEVVILWEDTYLWNHDCKTINGELEWCRRCGGCEGDMTADCCGRKIPIIGAFVYADKINFAKGVWIHKDKTLPHDSPLVNLLALANNEFIQSRDDELYWARVGKVLMGPQPQFTKTELEALADCRNEEFDKFVKRSLSYKLFEVAGEKYRLLGA